MNDYVLINVKNSISRFISKCNKYNMPLLDIKYVSNKEIIVKVKKSDLKNIERYNYYSEIKIYKKLGKDSILEKIYSLKYFLLTFILCIIIMYFISNIIFKINVIHSNKKIRDLLYSELEEYGIKKLSIKKDFDSLEEIKNNILEKNKDSLEWISITNVGMTYVIRVEERILDNIKNEEKYCDIVSTKEAFITNIYAIRGEVLISENDFVRPNDVLISGDILLNNEIKGITCASGIIKGKVWYNTTVTIERKYYKKEYTNNKRYNITLRNKVLRKNKYTNYDKKYIVKNNIFSIYKELEYKNMEYKYTEEEGIKRALLELESKFKTKFDESGKILETKILTKDITGDYITLNVFVVAEENIGKIILKEPSSIQENEEKVE